MGTNPLDLVEKIGIMLERISFPIFFVGTLLYLHLPNGPIFEIVKGRTDKISPGLFRTCLLCTIHMPDQFGIQIPTELLNMCLVW